MRLHTRRGFTFTEVLVVMVVMGMLASIGVPRIRKMKERSYQATLRSDLGNLRTAQEAYFAENHRYATDTVGLEFRASANVSIVIESSDIDRGWKATAIHAWLGEPCRTAVGAEASGVESGLIVCSNLSETSAAAASGN
jgi:prepilin-type N-terminal cleavage/methylation domain-containing protein